MRILILNYEYPPLGGGAAPVCRDLAVSMAAEGHKVVVVTMGFDDLPRHEVKDGVEIFRLKCWRKNQASCMPWEQMSYIVEAEQFLEKYLRKHSFDICHTHFVIPTGAVALWVKNRFGIPYIVTGHGSDVEGYNDKKWMRFMHYFLRPFWKQIAGNSFAVVSPSSWLLKLMKKAKKDGRYVLIPNGLDFDKYEADQGQKEHRILVMGRMQKSKNVQTILKAVHQVPDDLWGDWQADILGDGPYRAQLEELADQLDIRGRVQFRGWIKNGSEEQLEYLRKASVYISASHFENCPMSVLEAAASGCYPLLSDIEGHRQFFSKEKSWEKNFFSADDDRALSEKIAEVLKKDTALLWENCINRKMYGMENVTRKYLKLLEQAAKKEAYARRGDQIYGS